MGHKSDRMIKAVYGHMMEERRREHADLRAEYYESLRTNSAQGEHDP